MIFDFLKRKKSYKLLNIFISKKLKQIIVAPYHFNKAGINYEQEKCDVYSLDIDDKLFGAEIINALNKFSYKNRNLQNDKIIDWPAFKHSKLKTIKAFKENYLLILIHNENGFLTFNIEYPNSSCKCNKNLIRCFEA